MKGILYLIPSLLGESAISLSMPSTVMEVICGLSDFIVESEKSARRFLIKAGLKNLDAVNFSVLDEHTENKNFKNFLIPLLEGRNVGLISDAGCPAIADPGSEVVLLAHYSGIRVIPLVGPSSIILALMASGLNGQKFCFHGYLPAERHHRIKKIKELENESSRKSQTQVFIEAPYRNQKLLEDILANCKNETLLCVAADITSPSEFIATRSIKEWKKHTPSINKIPTVFLIFS